MLVHALFTFLFFVPVPLPPAKEPDIQRIDMNVRAECLKAPIALEDCDVTKLPIKCERVIVSFRSECAEIVIRK